MNLNLAFSLLGERVTATEAVGNLCALATVWLALRRTVWCWPVQLGGSLLLFVVFAQAHLAGNATRQAIVAAMSVYGWARWRRQPDAAPAVRRMARAARGRVALVMLGLAGLCAVVLAGTGSSASPIPDGWILAGTLLANVLMARAYLEFWWVWLAVNAVGVPLCVGAHLYVTAATFLIFAGLSLRGLWKWAGRLPASTSPAAVAVNG